MADAVKHITRVHQLDFIGLFFQAKVKNRLFVKLDSRYADYFPEYYNYFGRALRLLKSMYGMHSSEKLFAGELIEWLLEAGLIRYHCQMFIYYKYAPGGTKIVVLSCVYDCVYLYTSEAFGKWFLDALGKIFRVKLLGYAH